MDIDAAPSLLDRGLGIVDVRKRRARKGHYLVCAHFGYIAHPDRGWENSSKIALIE